MRIYSKQIFSIKEGYANVLAHSEINIKHTTIFNTNLNTKKCCFCKKRNRFHSYFLEYVQLCGEIEGMDQKYSVYICSEPCVNLLLLSVITETPTRIAQLNIMHRIVQSNL